MDGRRFDEIMRALGTGVSRRRGVLAGLAALAAAAAGQEAGAVPEASCRPNRMECRSGAECCSGACRNGWCAPKNGRNRGKGKKDRDRNNGDKNKGNGGNGGGNKPTPTPTPACTPLGGSCAPGTDPCCAAGGAPLTCGSTFAGVSPANRTCQDCSAPPTAAGAYCQTPNGNQCCGGRPDCWVGVRVEDGEPACVSSGQCSVGSACAADGDCPSGQLCLEAASGCGCSTGTFCGTPCA